MTPAAIPASDIPLFERLFDTIEQQENLDGNPDRAETRHRQPEELRYSMGILRGEVLE